MKFERGRKKNQLIWSFILKDIASQSSVFNKNQKKKSFRGRIRFRSIGDVLWGFTRPLELAVAGLGH